MSTLARDLAIVVGLVLALVAWRVFRSVSGRTRPRAEQATRGRPVAGTTAFVAGVGWSGPTQDPPAGELVQEYVHHMTCNLWHVDPTARDDQRIGDTVYTNAFTGQAEGRAWYLANACTPAHVPGGSVPADGQLTVAVCTVAVGELLPPLWVGPRDRPPYVHMLLKEVTLESEDFDRRFRVQALDRKYATDMVSPRVMELLMQRDDWTFFLSFSQLVCLSREPFADVVAMQRRLSLVQSFVGMIPSFVEKDRGAHLPTLPDGTQLDPTDPHSVESMKQAFMAMTPAERERAMTQLQAQGMRFVAGMFGEDVPDAVVEGAQRRMRDGQHEEGRG